MKLTELEICGFKSFADRTRMKFDGGITGVVGPNGSGKSNISDAMRWVLGEQSAKTLRGSKMEDVIFGGSEKRKPMAFSEVSLTLDNSDKTLPVQFAEVVITRRIYRSGESEYFINRSACRLKDIIDLFRDTGVGKEGYSLIGQGRIDEILSQKGEDRRSVFEEAAGIAKYKARRSEAEHRIENTNENLERVEDVLEEASRAIGPLAKQAEVAKEYNLLREQFRRTEVSAFVTRFDAAKRKAANAEKDITARSDALADAQKEHDSLRAQRDRLDAQQRQDDEKNRDLRAAVVDGTSALEQRQADEKLLLAAIDRDTQEKQRLTEEREKAQARLAAAEEERESLQKAYDENETHLIGESAELDALTCAQEEESRLLDAQREDIERDKEQLLEDINRLSDVRSARARLTAMRQAINTRVSETESELETLSRQRENLRESEKQAAGELDTATEVSGQAAAALTNVDSLLSENRALRGSAQAKTQQLSLQRQQTETRLKVLREMERDYSGYQHAVKQVMLHAAHTGDKGLVGVVASVLKVPKELELAVETALGGALQNIICETEQDAKRMIDFLRANNYGRATFLPVSTVTGRTLNQNERAALSTDGCLGVLSELISYDKRFSGIADNLLGRTVVARDLDSGIAIMRKVHHSFRLVTLRGDVMNPGGSMTGGSVQSRVTSLLSRDREIKEHTSALEALDRQLAQARGEERSLENTRLALHEKRDAAEEDKRRTENEVLRLNQVLTHVRKEQSDMDARILSVKREIEKLSGNLADVMRELSGIMGQQGAAESDHEHKQQEIVRRQEALSEKRSDLDARRDALTKRRIACASEKRDNENRLAGIDRLQKENETLRETLAQTDKAIAHTQEALNASEKKLADARQALSDAQETLAKANTALELADTDSGNRQALRRELETQSEARAADISRITEQLASFRGTLERAKNEQDALAAHIWSEYELTYEGCLEICDRTLTLTEADKRISELRQKIRALGNVNPAAAEQYAEAKKRFDDLTAQKNDLLTAKADLKRIADELTGKMKTQFAESFKQLDERFRETFRALFGGGTARLILTDEKDVLNCGIDIAAQPPGKKLQMLSLLSGGERALTATAILFAMLDLRPTPFCVLDEIEAALDDANIENFAQYLSRYSAKTQFIVVTHRKGTMECCDSLYGVTMAEKGVSRMVSVSMSEAVETVKE